MMRFLFLLMFVFFISACKTSGELRSERRAEDPVGVKTLKNPRLAKKVTKSAEELDLELELLKGRYEELSFLHKRDQKEAQKRIESLESRNKVLRSELERLQWQEPEVSVSEVSEGATKKLKGSELLLSQAIQDIEKKRYDRAQSLLSTFLRTYPKHKKHFHAELARAMSLYAEKQYQRSLISFNKVIDTYPKHKSVSLAWFGQGAAFHLKGQGKDAALFFEETKRRAPKSKEAQWAQNILKKRKKPPENLFEAFPHWKKGL